MTTRQPLLRDRIRQALSSRPEPVKKKQPVTPSRQGLVHTGVYITPETHRRLVLAALDSGTTRQAIMAAALDDWLMRKHDR